MARRKRLSDLAVTKLQPAAKRYAVADPELVGHYVRVQPSGAKSFVAVARNPQGKQVWATLDGTDKVTVEESRDRARAAIKRIKAGLPAFEPLAVQPDTFQGIAESWLKRHVQAKRLRSEGEITRLLKAHVFPRWGTRPFLTIRRGDVAALLDEVEDDHGARQADYVLAIVRGIFNWFATRNDEYFPPIARGMRRTEPKTRKRARMLDDDELRAVWSATEDAGTFGAIVRTALLTAQRRKKVAAMRWEDISADGEWRIPTEEREKGAAGSLLLPDAALEIIRAQPRLSDNPYVFAGRGKTHFNGFSKAKAAFDGRVRQFGEPIMPWVIHDLRRTARSLMSRAGVRPDIAERVLGHVISGVERVYDRHQYSREKAEALRQLAGLISSIARPQQKVVSLQRTSR